MALTFNALGDGNCFYNSIMTRLAVDWLNGTLPRNKTTSTQLAALFGEVGKFEPSLNFGEKLPADVQDITDATIDEIFTIILEHFRIDDETIDWVKYQQLMGPVAREFIINKIENDDAIKHLVLGELTQAVEYTLDISTVDDINYPAHFSGMTEIKSKLRAAVMDVGTDIDIRKIALTEWFQTTGFAFWLRGHNGVALDTTVAGVLELKAFTKLFNISAQFRMPGDAQGVNQLVTGFGDITPLRLGTQEAEPYTVASISSLEYTGGHWKTYLADDEAGINKKICTDYTIQRAAYTEKLFYDNAKSNLDCFGTYSIHAATLELTQAEYCKVYNLTDNEYENNLLPGEVQNETQTSFVNRGSVSAAAVLLIAISAIVVLTAPIGIPSALFTLAFFASVATLGLNAIDVISDYFFPELTLQSESNKDNPKVFEIEPTVDAALQQNPKPIIISAANDSLADTQSERIEQDLNEQASKSKTSKLKAN